MGEIIDKIKCTLRNIEVIRSEYVGADIGKQLVEKGSISIFIAVLAIMIYIAFRFEYRLAISAIIALCHDILIILGIFSLFRIDFDLSVLAAILAILGYSINDTVVIFDRIRENFRKVRNVSAIDIVNMSINQTLSRTIMTSFLTLLVVLVLLIFGGQSLFGFALALTIGIIIGTYSSIYIAGVLSIKMGLSRFDILERRKVDNSP